MITNDIPITATEIEERHAEFRRETKPDMITKYVREVITERCAELGLARPGWPEGVGALDQKVYDIAVEKGWIKEGE